MRTLRVVAMLALSGLVTACSGGVAGGESDASSRDSATERDSSGGSEDAGDADSSLPSVDAAADVADETDAMADVATSSDGGADSGLSVDDGGDSGSPVDDGGDGGSGSQGDAAVDAGPPPPPYVCPSCPAGTRNCGACVSTATADDPNYGCSTTSCTPCNTGPESSYVTQTCKAGACAIGACPPGRADCDGDPANGCEADLLTAATCGSCGNKCGAGQLCESGSCVTATTCPSPTTDCSGGCRDLNSDPEACNSCTNPCPSVGGTPTCTNGTCDIICAAGFYACASGDGCCQNATACAPGYTICDAACVNLRTDANNCGACGNACQGTDACGGGQCVASSSVHLISGLTGIEDLAVDAKNVYYIADKTVWQASKTTFAPQRIGDIDENEPLKLAVGNGHVYWTSNGASAIRAVPIGGGTPQTLYAATTPIAISVDATYVYWSEDNTTQTLKAPIAGGGTPVQVAAFSSFSLQNDATNVYMVGDPGFVYPYDGTTVPIAVNKATGAQLVYQNAYFTDGSTTWFGLAMNTASIFSVMDDTSYVPTTMLITAQHKTGAGGPPMYAPEFDEVDSMAADDCNLVFYGSYGGNYGVYALLLTEGSNQVTLMTQDLGLQNVIAIDDTYVYWLDESGLGRIAR
jgi:hypothetical protein